jgi:hypothetical protein
MCKHRAIFVALLLLCLSAAHAQKNAEATQETASDIEAADSEGYELPTSEEIEQQMSELQKASATGDGGLELFEEHEGETPVRGHLREFSRREGALPMHIKLHLLPSMKFYSIPAQCHEKITIL